MSPPPVKLTDRWRDGRGAGEPGPGTLYWHVLLGDDPQLVAVAQTAQSRIAHFPGLHLTPLQWLHLTVLIAGPASQVTDLARNEMLAIARSSLAGIKPISVDFSRVFFHPEAITLLARPAEALAPVREAAERATRAVMGGDSTDDSSCSPLWTPHMTLCYSTSEQPAGPVIAALGQDLPSCRVSVNALSLVVQRDAEWLWAWSAVGAVTLGSDLSGQREIGSASHPVTERINVCTAENLTSRPRPALQWCRDHWK